MAGVNIGNVGLTFTHYIKDVVETLNHKSKARLLCKKNYDWAGSHLEGRVHTARSTAIGYVEDGGAFPAADKQDYQTWKAYRKFVVGSVQLTDGVMATASKDSHVARDVVTSEIKGLMDNILKFENGFFFRNGDGSVATVQTGTATTSVLVDDARMLWDGGVYDVYNSGLTTNYGTITVSKVASSPTAAGYATVTSVADIPDATAGNLLVWSGCVNRAITGLKKLVDDSSTTFQNISTATYPRYTSLVLSNSGTLRELTPGLFRQMLAGIKQRLGADSPANGLTVLTNNWGGINIEELYEGDLRLSPETKVAGLAIASFQSALGKIDILTDSDAPYSKIYFVDFDKVYRGVQKELDWRRNKDGGIFTRSDVSAVYTATAIEIADMYIMERGSSGRLDDVDEDIKSMY